MAFYFPDNTVLINFHILNRWDLVSALVQGASRWAGSVAYECEYSDRAAYPGLFEAASDLFGAPERPLAAELVDIKVLRDAMADPAEDHIKKHLGEAETIVMVRNRFQGSRFITDDESAAQFATADGIRCFGTGDLLTVSEKQGRINATQHDAMFAILRSRDRAPRYYFSR